MTDNVDTQNKPLDPRTVEILQNLGLSPDWVKRFAEGVNEQVNNPPPPTLGDIIKAFIGARLPARTFLENLFVKTGAWEFGRYVDKIFEPPTLEVGGLMQQMLENNYDWGKFLTDNSNINTYVIDVNGDLVKDSDGYFNQYFFPANPVESVTTEELPAANDSSSTSTDSSDSSGGSGDTSGANDSWYGSSDADQTRSYDDTSIYVYDLDTGALIDVVGAAPTYDWADAIDQSVSDDWVADDWGAWGNCELEPDPIVLNLSGGHVHSTDKDTSNVLFDMREDGQAVKTGWITADEGFLVIDRNNNGIIDDHSEMISERTVEGSATGFAAMAAMDENGDGKLDAQDSVWSSFKVWVDANLNGTTEEGELLSLDQLQIASIGLQAQGRWLYDNGNIIGNTGTFAYEDGSTGEIAEAWLTFGNETQTGTRAYVTSNSVTFRNEDGQVVEYLTGSEGQVIELGESGVDIVFAGTANDTLIAGSGQDVVMFGGSGHTTMIGGTGTATMVGYDNSTMIGGDDSTMIALGGGNTIIGGNGNDAVLINGDQNTLIGGVGESLILVEGSSNTVLGGGGSDVLLVSGDANSINLDGGFAESYIEGNGNAISVSAEGAFNSISNSDLTICGSAENDVLSGGDGNDLLIGGIGSDSLDGGAGVDTVSYSASLAAVTVDIAAGSGYGGDAQGDTYSGIEAVVGSNFDDNLFGADGNEILDGGLGANILTGGNGSDQFKVDMNYGGGSQGTSHITDYVRGSDSFALSGQASNAAKNDELWRAVANKTTDNGSDLLTFSNGTAVQFDNVTGIANTDIGGAAISVANVSYGETDSLAAVTFNLTEALSSDITVNWSTADGTGIAGTDYVATSGSVVIHAGETSGTGAISLLHNSGSYDDHSIKINVTSVDFGFGEISIDNVSGVIESENEDGTSLDVHISESTLSPDLFALAQNAGWDGVSAKKINFYIDSGVVVGDLNVGGDWGLSSVSLVNNGVILGMGGAGGIGGSGAGQNGHDAMTISASMSLTINQNIAGGGGGGGAGGSYNDSINGGTGAGYQNGGVAQSGSHGYYWVETFEFFTGCEYINYDVAALYGDGGNGGALHSAGSKGQDGYYGYYGNQTYVAGAGGLSGKDINMSGNGSQTLDLTVLSAQTHVRIDADASDMIVLRRNDQTWTNEGNYYNDGYTTYRDTAGHAIEIIGGATVKLSGVLIDGSMVKASSEDLATTLLASDLLAIATDTDGLALSVTSVGNAVNGMVALNGDGNVVFTPDADYNSTASFDYTIRNSAGDETTVTAVVDLAAVNDAPVATSYSAMATEDTALTVLASTLLAEASDVDSDALTLASVGNASHGVVNLNAQGNVVFMPDANYNGVATFDYTISDGHGGMVTATATVKVSAANDAPVAGVVAAQSTNEDAAVTILASALLASATDVDGDVISISSVGNASHGTVSLNAQGNVVFTPSANYNGTATFDYTISDGQGGFSTATATVDVAAVNDAPVASAYSSSVPEDASLTILASSLLALASDIDGDALTLTSVGNASHGTVSLNAQSDVVFTPTFNYSGPANFDYTISDGHGGASIATATINVAPTHTDVSVSTGTINESSGVQLVTFTLAQALVADVVISYATSDGTALAGSDYVAKTGSVTILAGQTAGTATVSILDDAVYEADQTFVVSVTGVDFGDGNGPVAYVASGTQTILGTGLGAENAPSLTISDVAVGEGAGVSSFTVSLSGASDYATTVDYATVSGSATSGSDFMGASGTLIFAPGQTSQTVGVAVIDDTASENAESFSVNLSNATNATLSDGQGVGTITDNDVPTYNIHLTTNTLSPNLYSLATAAGWNGLAQAYLNFYIDSGVVVGDLDTSADWGAASISLVNNGLILGQGGAGGTGSRGAGQNGHDAMTISASMSLTINQNIAGGGGGGGAGGGDGWYAGGGAGAGYQNGGVAQSGSHGSYWVETVEYFTGCDYVYEDVATLYGDGGDGGALHSAGSKGQDGYYGYYGNQTYVAGAGGLSGKDINMSGNGSQTLDLTDTYTGSGIYISTDAVDTVNIHKNGLAWNNLGNVSFNGSSYVYYQDTASHNLYVAGGANVRIVADPLTLIGTDGGDTLIGDSANDMLFGLGGADTLQGGTGADSYLFGRGDGADVVNNQSHAGEGDRLVFGASIASDQLWFARSGNDLFVSVIGTSDQVNIQGWYSSAANHVDSFKTADGKALLDSQVDNLVNAMASFTPPAMGQTTLPQNYQDQLSPVIAANWHS